MRKLLLILCAVLLASCNQKQKTPERPSSCDGNLMVIDISRFPSVEDFHIWAENNPYVCFEDSDLQLAFVEMNQIVPSSSATPREIAEHQAHWLANNGSKINFYESYRYIEDSHRIKDAALVTDINRYASFRQTNLATIRGRITEEQGNYDDDVYEYYVRFDINSPGLLSLSRTFQYGGFCYSIPMLRSVAAVNGVKNNDIMFIGDYNPPGGTRRIIVKFKNKLYDFSDEPRKETTVSKRKACTPISDYVNGAKTQAEKAEWLRNHGKDLCPGELDVFLGVQHTVVGQTVTKTGKPMEKKVSEINALVKSIMYERYFGFKTDTLGELTDLVEIPLFDPNNICYSAPLLRFIIKGLASSDTIVFTPAEVAGKKTIIIEIKGVLMSPRDFSDEPAFLEAMSPL